jgi:hypothetical protein
MHLPHPNIQEIFRNPTYAAQDVANQLQFEDLVPGEIRDLREYPIPTIEIALNENTQLDEIISLFVEERKDRQKLVIEIVNSL